MNLDGVTIKRAVAAILLAIIAVLPGTEARCARDGARENDQLAFARAGSEAISLRAGEPKSVARKGLDVVAIPLICGQSDSIIPGLVENGSSIGLRGPVGTARLLIDFRGRAPPAA